MAESTAAQMTQDEIEASRQKRLDRIMAKRRDRGGIFKPAETNPLLDMLMSRDVSGKSPEKPKPRKSVAPAPPCLQVGDEPAKKTKATRRMSTKNLIEKPGESSKSTKKVAPERTRKIAKKATKHETASKTAHDVSDQDEDDAGDVARKRETKGVHVKSGRKTTKRPAWGKKRQQEEEEEEAINEQPLETRPTKKPPAKATKKKVETPKGRPLSSSKQKQKSTDKGGRSKAEAPLSPPDTSASSSRLETILEASEMDGSRTNESEDLSAESRKKRKRTETMAEASSSKGEANKKRRPITIDEPEPSKAIEKRRKPYLTEEPRKPSTINTKLPKGALTNESARRIFSSPPKLPSIKWRNPVEDAKVLPPQFFGSPLKDVQSDDELDIL